MHGVMRHLEREAAQVGHQPLRVAGWCPTHLCVPEEFDHMGPRDVERDVKGGEGEAEREDLKADQVRGQDRGRFNEGELVRLIGDEVAMLLARLCVVRRVDEAVERPVDVAAAVKGVEAQVQSDVEEWGPPDRMQQHRGGRSAEAVLAQPGPDLEGEHVSQRLHGGNLELKDDLLGCRRLERTALVEIGHRLQRRRLPHRDRKREEAAE
mmetsp:Transcript_43891/g.145366  ORF Transcript_43891/g.145366 Transcript_43891/m.145366 type:complete len:209 (-) Transcript_43891:278-904(-)